MFLDGFGPISPYAPYSWMVFKPMLPVPRWFLGQCSLFLDGFWAYAPCSWLFSVYGFVPSSQCFESLNPTVNALRIHYLKNINQGFRRHMTVTYFALGRILQKKEEIS